MKRTLSLLIFALQVHCKSAETSEPKEVFISDNVKLEAAVSPNFPLFQGIQYEVTNQGQKTIQCQVTISADVYVNDQKMAEVILNETLSELKAGERRSVDSASSRQVLLDMGIPGTKYVRGGDSRNDPKWQLDPIDIFFDCRDQKKNPIKATVDFVSSFFKRKNVMHEERTAVNIDGLSIVFMTNFPLATSIEMKISNGNSKPVRCDARIKYDIVNNGVYLGSGSLNYSFEKIGAGESATLPEEFATDKLVETGVPGIRFNPETLSKELKCQLL